MCRGDSSCIAVSRPDPRSTPIRKLERGTHWPQDRKMYPHHASAIHGDAKPWENLERNFVEGRYARIRAWAKVELELLLYALSPTEAFRHEDRHR
jgi:hypothetical protein